MLPPYKKQFENSDTLYSIIALLTIVLIFIFSLILLVGKVAFEATKYLALPAAIVICVYLLTK